MSTPGVRLVLNIRSYWDEHMGIVFRSMSWKKQERRGQNMSRKQTGVERAEAGPAEAGTTC